MVKEAPFKVKVLFGHMEIQRRPALKEHGEGWFTLEEFRRVHYDREGLIVYASPWESNGVRIRWQ